MEARTITKTEAVKITGGLSKTSKMPGYSYGLPASSCKTGGKLCKIDGSVCYKCYAKKGFYAFQSAKTAHKRRISSLSNPQWVNAMIVLIKLGTKKHKYFRWHDSGDIQSMQHLKNIIEVCKGTPEVKHWLPTHEHKLIKQYLSKGNELPDNITVRISAPMIDGPAPKTDFPTSTVSKDKRDDSRGYLCPSSQQDNKCGDCRACWDKSVQNVDYKYH